METEEKAQEWQNVILEVASGRLTVTEASVRMGVSRKTFYQKQERALSAMLDALKDRPAGRPCTHQIDPEKEELREELEASRKAQELLAARLRIQEVLRETLLESGISEIGGKKKRKT